MCCACLDIADNFIEVNQGYMAHDIFISHAHKDQGIADEICRRLESARLKCWIAERDLSASEDWTVATRTAIETSRLMVLLLSENANAARHIEREIAHAFYTRRVIVPLRLTRTLPKRDFLFYLGNVRWIDAFNLPEEQDLEALTAIILGMVHPPAVSPEATPAHPAFKATGTSKFTNWIGALQASHYQTLEILKRVAIGASLFAVVWLVWAVTWQPKQGANGKLRSMYSGSGASLSSARPSLENASVSIPAYTYTRFGLWVAPSVGPTPSVQRGPQNTASTTPGMQPAPATASQRANVGQNPTGEAESPRVHDSASSDSLEEDLGRIVNQRVRHLRRSRPKGHNGRPSSLEVARFTHLKSRIMALLHQIAAGGKESREPVARK
jgi:hypothetical protein